MTRLTHARRIAGAAALAALLALAAGCSKKSNVLNPLLSVSGLEGQRDTTAQLFAWPDEPTVLAIYHDENPPGYSGDDEHTGDLSVYAVAPGAVRTMILDGSPATTYQEFRRTAPDQYQSLRDFTLSPTRKWLDTDYEVYSLNDLTPQGAAPAYLARGLVGGVATQRSPLTNVATVHAPIADIQYLGNPTVTDSLFEMSWTPVSNAKGYWITMFQYRSDMTIDEKIALGTPSPLLDGKVKDFYVGFVPAPTTTYRLGDRVPGGLILTHKISIAGQIYLVRIAAVDAQGQLIGFTHGDTASTAGPDETTFYRYVIGAASVEKKRAGQP